MKDRISGKPGRVLITPENGSAPYYAVMTRADEPEQEGTILNKKNLLTDETAALFGLDADAAPNDMFAWLGKYNQHWWARKPAGERTFGYAKVETLFTSELATMAYQDTNISYSDSVSIDQDTGTITLVDPQIVTFDYEVETAETASEKMELLKGKYAQGFREAHGSIGQAILPGIFYIPADAEYGTFYSSSNSCISGVWFKSATAKYEITSELFNIDPSAPEYVNSVNRNAYPDAGEVDEFICTYLGVPFDNAVTAPRIAIGSYEGLGKSGEANPNILTFDFVPKFVIVFKVNDAGDTGTDNNPLFLIRGYNGITLHAKSGSYPNQYYTMKSTVWDGSTVSWYSSGETDYLTNLQKNMADSTYAYLAIG